MIPGRASLLLMFTAIVSLAVAACDTVRKPIRGFDKQPPGSIVLPDDPGGTVMMWPIFDLPQTQQPFRPRVDGRDVAYMTAPDGFYQYYEWLLYGWTGGWTSWLQGFKPGTYVVELADSAGQVWGRSAPLAVGAGGGTPADPAGQLLAVAFANFDDKVASWIIDPATQDSDMATDEITVTNLLDEDVIVERCMIASGRPTSCASVGAVAAGADLLTVERMADLSSREDHQALVIRLASDASQSYQRDLLKGTGSFSFGSTCQVERIFVHGTRPVVNYSPTGVTGFAMSTCYGNQSGPM